MKAYSRDLRIRALDALDLGTPRPEVIRLFGVSTATLTRWRRRQRETGSLAQSPRPGPPGPKRAGLKAGLLPHLEAHPDATLEELCQWWEQTEGVRVSVSPHLVVTTDGSEESGGRVLAAYIVLQPGQRVMPRPVLLYWASDGAEARPM